jgi:hypothetical protein
VRDCQRKDRQDRQQHREPRLWPAPSPFRLCAISNRVPPHPSTTASAPRAPARPHRIPRNRSHDPGALDAPGIRRLVRRKGLGYTTSPGSRSPTRPGRPSAASHWRRAHPSRVIWVASSRPSWPAARRDPFGTSPARPTRSKTASRPCARCALPSTNSMQSPAGWHGRPRAAAGAGATSARHSD